MADIDVVPRRRSHVWVWVILAIIVLAILWWAMNGRHSTAATGEWLHGITDLAAVVSPHPLANS